MEEKLGRKVCSKQNFTTKWNELREERDKRATNRDHSREVRMNRVTFAEGTWCMTTGEKGAVPGAETVWTEVSGWVQGSQTHCHQQLPAFTICVWRLHSNILKQAEGIKGPCKRDQCRKTHLPKDQQHTNNKWKRKSLIIREKFPRHWATCDHCCSLTVVGTWVLFNRCLWGKQSVAWMPIDRHWLNGIFILWGGHLRWSCACGLTIKWDSEKKSHPGFLYFHKELKLFLGENSHFFMCIKVRWSSRKVSVV